MNIKIVNTVSGCNTSKYAKSSFCKQSLVIACVFHCLLDKKNYITCSADLKKLYEAVTTFLLSSDLVMSCCHRRLMFSAQFHIASGSKWPSLMSFSARCFTSVALWHVFLNRGNENVSKTLFTVSSDSETNHKHVWCKVEKQSDLGTLGSKFTRLLTTSTQEPIQRCSNYNPCEPHRENFQIKFVW